MVETLHLSKYNRMNKTTTRTVRNVLNKDEYAFRSTLRKIILLTTDFPKRLQCAKKVLKFYESIIGPCFYLDGNKFILKLHPQD